MSRIIEDYYKQVNIMPLILQQKMDKLERNPDIQKEFEDWIKNKEYAQDNCVTIEGYTAKDVAALSELLDGEGAFMLLLELRENPEKAKRRINEGFKIK